MNHQTDTKLEYQNFYDELLEKMLDSECFVPDHMRQGYLRYLQYGIKPGSFGTAILSNDLKNAVCTADHINSQYIITTVKFMIWNFPANAWGSDEIVNNWKGLENNV